jgi:two-component system, LytTR family, response regulator
VNKVRIVVVEDEIIIADNICDVLTELGYNVAEPAMTYTEALDTIIDFKPDLAIIDIHLSSKKDGIDLAQKIMEEYDFPFIFLTSNSDMHTLDRAKKVSPAAYLIKPFSKEELYTSIEIALSNYKKQLPKIPATNQAPFKQVLFIKQKHLFVKVRFDDILFLKSDHVYLEVFALKKQRFVVRGSLSDYINKLDDNFIRVHRGYIINLNHIETINQDYIKIEMHQIPIGQNYKEAFLHKINLG